MQKKNGSWYSRHPIITGTISGLIVLVIGGVVNWYFTRQRVANKIAEAIEILDVQNTSESLRSIAVACREAAESLGAKQSTPSSLLVDTLRKDFQRLSDDIDKIKTSEAYSVAELRQLAGEVFMSSDKMDILKRYVGKTKRQVTGLSRLKPQLAKIGELLESLDRELEREPTIDIEMLRRSLSAMENVAGAAQASLDSRQRAALATLEKFGKGPKPTVQGEPIPAGSTESQPH